MRLFRRFVALALAASSLSTAVVSAETNLLYLDLKPAWTGLKFTLPLDFQEPADGTKRKFLVEQDGRIWILPQDRNSTEAKIFLDITKRRPHRQLEEGLLALAFHPQYKSNGKFYVFYTQQGPKRNVLSEIQASKANPDEADLSTERVIIEIPKPYWNHNGSTLVFGPDGYLYFSTGDGGGGFDPLLAGQNDHQLLGKILRIDVNSRTGSLPYGIPKDNPFVARDKAGNLKEDPFDTNSAGVRPEIWATGLRNVWRMSFDRETGELWAGDVGQNLWEEIDLIVKGGNYGWSIEEGFHPVDRPMNKAQKAKGQLIPPVIEYAHGANVASQCRFPDHGFGVSVTGGYVYRGKKLPSLRDIYVYADYQTGHIWGLRHQNGKLQAYGLLVAGQPGRTISSFGEDRDGELYVISFDGRIYELVEPK